MSTDTFAFHDLAAPYSLARPVSPADPAGRPITVAVIGAGSAQFSMTIVRDLCLTPGLAGSLVRFMDISQERLDAILQLARRYASEVGAALRFEATTERAAALDGAAVVINTAAAQSHADEEHQRATWEAHGYYRGIRFYQHNLELMLDVARDIERICPDAWLLQSGNPVFEGCTLMTRETGVKVVGLCHGHYGYAKIARVLGLDQSQISFEATGVNHCIWMTQFRYRGEDAYPLLDRWIEEESAAYWDRPVARYTDTQLSRAAIDMYRTFGLMPIGDTPRFGGYQYVSNWWYHTDLASKQRWYGDLGGFDSDIGWGRYLEDIERDVARIRQLGSDTGRRLTDDYPPVHSGEQIVPIIDALVNDRQAVFQVNVPNNGILASIDDDVVVEVPALVARDRIQPIVPAPLPRALRQRILGPKILEMELNLEIYHTHDPRAWFHQVMLDHRTQSPEQALAAMHAVLDLPFNARWRERFGDLDRVMEFADRKAPMPA